MLFDARDPHYILGVEHGRAEETPYVFQDAENQRRYLLGYQTGTAERRFLGRVYRDQSPPYSFDVQQQQPRRITATDVQRYWQKS